MDLPYTTSTISDAILPIAAIDFSRDVIHGVGPYEGARRSNRLRGSKLGPAHYRALVAHIKGPLIEDTIVFHPQLGDGLLSLYAVNWPEVFQPRIGYRESTS